MRTYAKRSYKYRIKSYKKSRPRRRRLVVGRIAGTAATAWLLYKRAKRIEYELKYLANASSFWSKKIKARKRR